MTEPKGVTFNSDADLLFHFHDGSVNSGCQLSFDKRLSTITISAHYLFNGIAQALPACRHTVTSLSYQ